MTFGTLEGLDIRLVDTATNGARRNARAPEYYATLNRALDIAKDTRVSAVILRREGEYFCAGGTRPQLPPAAR